MRRGQTPRAGENRIRVRLHPRTAAGPRRLCRSDGKAEKEIAEKKTAFEKDHAQREQALAVREQEAAGLRAKVEAFPKELDAAVTKAVKEVTTRLSQEATAREEILKREHTGEKNVLTTRITSLDHTVQEQCAAC